jgi:prepilin-type N-terminal cleavage/methylation domain-containing protein
MRQQGYTLVELVIVVVIVGFLALITTKQFGSNTSYSSRAAIYYSAAQKLAHNWEALNMVAGTGVATASNVLPGTGSTAVDVLFNGKSSMASAYQPYWDRAGIRPLGDMATGGSGTYYINGSQVDFNATSSNTVVRFFAVPDEIVTQLVNKYGAGVTPLTSTVNLSNSVVQYGASNGDGTRILRLVIWP